jgi:hypothetical protein
MPVAANLILRAISERVQERNCYNKSSDGKGHLGLDNLGSSPVPCQIWWK